MAGTARMKAGKEILKRRHPHLLEANAWLFLRSLSAKYGRKITLANVPAEEWSRISARGFDCVWLMGVWKRSPGARKAALSEPSLRREYDAVLPGWKDEDVHGSPYAVYDYSVEPELGTDADLAALRAQMNRAGLALMLDFVPNHLALDHPLALSRPECFVQGSKENFQRSRGLFYEADSGRYLAHGKDPYFPAWTDTVQVNFFSPELRRLAQGQLMKIAETADAVRCDMAMLALNRIFKSTWKDYLKTETPALEYWQEIIPAVKKSHPRFKLMAEAYWDLEWELQRLGFDFTYDKRLYDRLLHSEAPHVRGHLLADFEYQSKMARFIENHDEQRARAAFGPGKAEAAASIVATLPGLRFFHEGQTGGMKIHTPIQMIRQSVEAVDGPLEKFYQTLLNYAGEAPLHDGEWKLLEVSAAWDGNGTHLNLLSWSWKKGKDVRLVVVNYSAAPAQGRVKLPQECLPKSSVALKDRMNGHVYEREARELKTLGLYADLAPWQTHLFEFQC